MEHWLCERILCNARTGAVKFSFQWSKLSKSCSCKESTKNSMKNFGKRREIIAQWGLQSWTLHREPNWVTCRWNYSRLGGKLAVVCYCSCKGSATSWQSRLKQEASKRPGRLTAWWRLLHTWTSAQRIMLGFFSPLRMLLDSLTESTKMGHILQNRISEATKPYYV